VLYIKFGLSWNFVKFSLFFYLLILVSFIDVDYRAVPASLCFIGIVGGLIFASMETVYLLNKGSILSIKSLPLTRAFWGLVIGIGFTYLFKFFGDTILSLYLSWKKKDSIEGERESLGLGDVDLMGMVGVFLGSKLAILTFFVAPFFGLVYSIFVLIFKRTHIIPYLPFLSLGAFFSFIWGNEVLRILHL
jgi:leader peptidase (prepilin peptidase)/N-methyltransferase